MTVDASDRGERKSLDRSHSQLSFESLIERSSVDSWNREGKLYVKELAGEVIVHARD